MKNIYLAVGSLLLNILLAVALVLSSLHLWPADGGGSQESTDPRALPVPYSINFDPSIKVVNDKVRYGFTVPKGMTYSTEAVDYATQIIAAQTKYLQDVATGYLNAGATLIRVHYLKSLAGTKAEYTDYQKYVPDIRRYHVEALNASGEVIFRSRELPEIGNPDLMSNYLVRFTTDECAPKDCKITSVTADMYNRASVAQMTNRRFFDYSDAFKALSMFNTFMKHHYKYVIYDQQGSPVTDLTSTGNKNTCFIEVKALEKQYSAWDIPCSLDQVYSIDFNPHTWKATITYPVLDWKWDYKYINYVNGLLWDPLEIPLTE